MFKLKGAFAITMRKVIETILSIFLFRTIFHYVKLLTGLWGLYSFMIAIFINVQARKFFIRKYDFLKKKYFPKYVDTFSFDSKCLVGYDLKTIISPAGGEASTSLLSSEDIKNLRVDLKNLKNEMNDDLFEFIFKSATRSALINIFTLMFSEYLKNNYEISLLISVTICISLSFIISFVSSYNYTKILSKEWKETLEELENKNSKKKSNRKHIVYIYDNPEITETSSSFPSASVIQDDPVEKSTVHQRKGDKKTKKQGKQQQQTEVTPSVEIKSKPNKFIVGIFANEIENEELINVKLMLLRPKFAENVVEITDKYFNTYLPHASIKDTNQKAGMKNAISNIGNIFQNFLLLGNPALKNIANDEFFGLRTLKECSFHVTDYYDAQSKFPVYFKTKTFKLHEKWAEFRMFLFIKFQVYDYRKSLASLPNKTPAPAPSTTPTFNLFSGLNQNTSTNPQAQPNLNNLFGSLNLQNLVQRNAASGTAPAPATQPNFNNLFSSLQNLQNNAGGSNTAVPTAPGTSQPAINLLESLANPNGGLMQLLRSASAAAQAKAQAAAAQVQADMDGKVKAN